MLRLFTAINIPENEASEFAGLNRDISGCNWFPQSKLHLTLNFIGDSNVWMYRQIQNQIHQILFEPFTLEPSGMDTFTNSDGSKILWVGIKENQQLLDLQSEIEELLYNMGVSIEKRAYKPHITIARLKKDADTDSLTDFLKDYATQSFTPLKVDSFGLYSSRITVDGTIHTRVAEYTAYSNELIS